MNDDLTKVEEVKALASLFGNQARLAEAVGVRISTVSMWKRNGIPSARRLQLVAVADELGIRLPDWVVPIQRFRKRKHRPGKPSSAASIQ